MWTTSFLSRGDFFEILDERCKGPAPDMPGHPAPPPPNTLHHALCTSNIVREMVDYHTFMYTVEKKVDG